MVEVKLKRKTKDMPPRIWTWTRIWGTITVATIYGMAVLLLFANVYPSEEEPMPTVFISFLWLVPVAIGMMSVYTIPAALRTNKRSLMMGIITAFIFLIATVLANTGLILCVCMALPFVLGFAGLAAMISSWLSRRAENESLEKSKRQLAFTGMFMLLPLLTYPIEAQIDSPVWERTVEDSIVIEARPEVVWANIIRMERISPEDQRPSFYHTMGIPRPIRATLDYEGLGGVRIGEFEYGLTFSEEITQWELYESVRFTIDVLHNDQSTPVLQQIGGAYIDLTAADYRIEVLDENLVRLHLHSDYTLSTNFNAYAAFWADWIMHDFQVYVLNTVKTRVEAY